MLQRNPYGKVPVLVDDGGVIYESAVINEYLEEKFSAAPLLPRDPLARSKARIWIDYMNTRVHPAASDITHNRNVERARERMHEHLTKLDEEMKDKQFIVGDYSLADITFIPFYTRRDRYQVTIEDNYPNLKRWGEALIQRPAVAPTI